MRSARWVTALALTSAAWMLSGCVADVPEHAWVIAPIAYDNDGGPGTDIIDVTYPMSHIAPDGAGGFWAESAGSWLHIDASGEADRRFNLDGEMQGLRVAGLAAVDPTTIVVSGSVDHATTTVWIFDAQTRDWAPIVGAEAGTGSLIGDIAVLAGSRPTDGEVYYTETRLEDATTVVRRVDLSSETWPVDASPRVEIARDGIARGDTARLFVAADGTLTMLLPDEEIVIGRPTSANAGSVPVERRPLHPSTPSPIFAVSATGMHARTVDVGSDDDATSAGDGALSAWFIDGGSSEARGLIEPSEACGVAIEIDGVGTTPPLCGLRSFAWLDPSTLIASAGSEGGSVLVEIRLPAGESDAG